MEIGSVTPVNYIELCKYINPIITSYAGFIRTTGYITHIPGYIIMMSDDESFISIIKIPIIFNIVFVAKINDLLKLKEENNMLNLLNLTYFLGSNIILDKMINYWNIYNDIDNKCNCIYSEDDCYNIDNFSIMSSNTNIGFINVSNGIKNFMIPASKSITNLNKADKVSLRLYNYINNQNNESIKTIRYILYKNKFKLVADIYTNILVV